jgi:hypothetical protein
MLARSMLRSRLLSLPVIWACSACSLLNRVHVDPVATSFQKPSNVAAYVAVTDGNEPVTELQLESFKIYENEQLLSSEDSHQTLLAPELAAYHHSVLLVDMSGEQGSDEGLARAVSSFVETVRRTQAVSVFVFDGSPTLRFLADFPKSADGATADAHALAKMGSSDASRNLNGAVLSGLKELDTRLAQQRRAVKVGTLVVFTRGADLAGRVSAVDVEKALDDTPDNVIAVSIAEQAGHALGDIGKSGTVKAQNADSVGIAFEEAATKTRAVYDKYYLIAYCSPARNGVRRLKVEVAYRDVKGNEKHGSFSQDFDASGFGPGCNPDSVPRFVPQVSPKPAASKAALANDSKSDKSDKADKSSRSDKPDTSDKPAPSEDDGSVAPPPDKPSYSH